MMNKDIHIPPYCPLCDSSQEQVTHATPATIYRGDASAPQSDVFMSGCIVRQDKSMPGVYCRDCLAKFLTQGTVHADTVSV